MKKPTGRHRGAAMVEPWEPDVLEEFYRRHVDAVTRFVARRVSDPNTAADLTAEVFLAVIDAGYTRQVQRGSEIAWLYGIARNVTSAEHRRAARESALNHRVAGHRLLESDDIARLEDKLAAEGEGRDARAALAALPAGERAVLELIVVDQLTVGEAASALGISKVTARVRLHRARRRVSAATRNAVPDSANQLVYSGSK